MISTLAGEKFRNKLLGGEELTEAEIVAGIQSVEDEATFMALAAADIASLRTKVENLEYSLSGDAVSRQDVLDLLR